MTLRICPLPSRSRHSGAFGGAFSAQQSCSQRTSEFCGRLGLIGLSAIGLSACKLTNGIKTAMMKNQFHYGLFAAREDEVSDFSQFAEQELHGWSNAETIEGYISLFAPAAERVVNALIDAVGAGPGMKVLDLCCGQGNVAAALLERGCTVAGLDFSPAMLALARKSVPDAEFIEGDAQDLPFDDDSFDAVVSNFGVCHIPDQPRALLEIKRVLKPAGSFAMTNWCGPDKSPPFRLLYQSVQQYGSPDVKMPAGPDIHQFAREDTVRDLLTAAGFVEISLRDVETQWVMKDPAQLFAIYERGTVRAAMMLTDQPSENRVAIARSVTDAVRSGFAADDGYRVPVLAALVSARAES